MFSKRKFLMVNKLTILVIVLAFISAIIPITYSIFKTDVKSDFKLDTAFYILKSDYYEKKIKLDEIVPSDEVYVYNFTVSNFEGNNVLETLMDYDLMIITTTNLPLEFELYMNENYYDESAKSAIISDVTSQDVDGTYFRYLRADTVRFGYEEKATNNYQLVVKFPKMYEDYKYQDILEYVGIIIESKQVIQ